jgi:hypothetical protein
MQDREDVSSCAWPVQLYPVVPSSGQATRLSGEQPLVVVPPESIVVVPPSGGLDPLLVVHAARLAAMPNA